MIKGYEPHILIFLTIPLFVALALGYSIIWIDQNLVGLYSFYVDYKYRHKRKKLGADAPYKRVMHEIKVRQIKEI